MCVGLCCVSVREITRPWLWLSALAWVDSYPMSRWLSNEQDLTVRVTHDQRGCRLSRQELVNGGWRNAWLGQNKKRNAFQNKQKNYNCTQNLIARKEMQSDKVSVETARLNRWIVKIEKKRKTERKTSRNLCHCGPQHCNGSSVQQSC